VGTGDVVGLRPCLSYQLDAIPFLAERGNRRRLRSREALIKSACRIFRLSFPQGICVLLAPELHEKDLIRASPGDLPPLVQVAQRHPVHRKQLRHPPLAQPVDLLGPPCQFATSTASVMHVCRFDVSQPRRSVRLQIALCKGFFYFGLTATAPGALAPLEIVCTDPPAALSSDTLLLPEFATQR
jgi:hypothetical protein